MLTLALSRKCGRVVCNSCSPHRITIPYQYIVQPPGTPRPGVHRYPSSLISGEGGYADFSSLGGGERVRLCNPCVPDPNTNPPLAQGSPTSIRGHARSQSSVGEESAYGSNMATPAQNRSYFDAYVRNRSATMVCLPVERILKTSSLTARIASDLVPPGPCQSRVSAHSTQNIERDTAHALPLRRAFIFRLPTSTQAPLGPRGWPSLWFVVCNSA